MKKETFLNAVLGNFKIDLRISHLRTYRIICKPSFKHIFEESSSLVIKDLSGKYVKLTNIFIQQEENSGYDKKYIMLTIQFDEEIFLDTLTGSRIEKILSILDL